jgi:hypothetical protein
MLQHFPENAQHGLRYAARSPVLFQKNLEADSLRESQCHPGGFFERTQAAPVRKPESIEFNDTLARDSGIATDDGVTPGAAVLPAARCTVNTRRARPGWESRANA